MSDATTRKIMLTDVVRCQDVAWAGFQRVLAIFNAIERMTENFDPIVAALAEVGATIAEDFSSEAESARDAYVVLLEQAGGKRHG
jgi:hypothetical protein